MPLLTRLQRFCDPASQVSFHLVLFFAICFIFNDLLFPGLQSSPEGVVKYKLRALAGFFQSVFDHLRQSDPRLVNYDRSVEKSIKLLQLLQFFTQLLLPVEMYYWAVYNGTIAIYNIARKLMTAGYSSKVKCDVH